MTLPPGLLIDAASGVLIVSLGLFVALQRPRFRTNVAFAVFAISWGLAWAVSNATQALAGGPAGLGAWPAPWLTAAVLLPAFPSLAYLLLRFPRRLERPIVAMAPAVGVVLVVVATNVADWATISSLPYPLVPSLVINGFLGALAGAALVLATRFARARGDGAARERSQIALTAAALAMDPLLRLGIYIAGGATQPGPGPVVALALAPLVLILCAAWLWATHRAGPVGGRTGRNVAISMIALPLAGMLLTPIAGGFPAAFDSGLMGLTRTLAVVVLAYAILKHQLLGIDVRVKWTIRQSTVAATFVAVFFAVSELAQQVFSGAAGPFFGIAAAAVLVFAIHPLQNLAQRVADKAMPGVRAPGDMTSDERLTLYRSQVELAWADGRLAPNERLMLQDLRRRLGINAEEAETVERAVAAAALEAR